MPATKRCGKDYSTFKENFNHSIPYFSDDYETITIIRDYCQPTPRYKYKGLWKTSGYVEFLRVPLDVSDKSKVYKTWANNTSYTWRNE